MSRCSLKVATECAVFYGLGDRDEVGISRSSRCVGRSCWWEDRHSIAHAILTSLGISAYALFDGDSEFEKRAIASGKSADKVADERKSHVAGNRTTLRYFNMPETNFPEEQVTDAFAVFQDHLETFMLNRWPEWQESCNSIEASADFAEEESVCLSRCDTDSLRRGARDAH